MGIFLKSVVSVFAILGMALTGPAPCLAAEQPAAQPSARPVEKRTSPVAARKSKGKHPREKENDGTEARNRFQADPVIKSKYELNGESLEVDPD